MAASDKAFVDANNASRRGRLAEDAAEKQEGRQQVLDERQDTLFNRSTTLFEQQQKFLKDERALQKFGRDANTATAMLLATGGQVYQPMLNVYERVPDGGKFHDFARNDDGTFRFDIEWQGQRYRTDKATFDEVGKMAMAIANPAKYLADSGSAAAAEADHQNKLEIERMKALSRRRADTQKFLVDGKLPTSEYWKGRKQYADEYKDLLNSGGMEGEEWQVDDGKGGKRRITLDEYVASSFMSQMGINISGMQTQPDGTMADMTPPDPTTMTFAEAQKFALDSGRAKDPIEAVDKALQMFLNNNRVDDLTEGMFGGDDELSKARRARVKAAKAEKGGDPDAAKAADEAGAQAVIDALDGKGNSVPETPSFVDDPIAAYAADQESASKKVREGASDLVGKVEGKIDEIISKFDKTRERVKKGLRAARARNWEVFLTGKPGKNKTARTMLEMAQTRSGLAKIKQAYDEDRALLNPEMQTRLDGLFGAPLRQTPLEDSRQSAGG